VCVPTTDKEESASVATAHPLRTYGVARRDRVGGEMRAIRTSASKWRESRRHTHEHNQKTEQQRRCFAASTTATSNTALQHRTKSSSSRPGSVRAREQASKQRAQREHQQRRSSSRRGRERRGPRRKERESEGCLCVCLCCCCAVRYRRASSASAGLCPGHDRNGKPAVARPRGFK